MHPFGALTVPPLATALGISHASPQMVYVADDPALGPYRADFGNSVLLLEERGFVDTLRNINTELVQQKLEEDHDKRINQKKKH